MNLLTENRVPVLDTFMYNIFFMLILLKIFLKFIVILLKLYIKKCNLINYKY